eukprot:3463652-Amphidinium_carterae.4
MTVWVRKRSNSSHCMKGPLGAEVLREQGFMNADSSHSVTYQVWLLQVELRSIEMQSAVLLELVAKCRLIFELVLLRCPSEPCCRNAEHTDLRGLIACIATVLESCGKSYLGINCWTEVQNCGMEGEAFAWNRARHVDELYLLFLDKVLALHSKVKYGNVVFIALKLVPRQRL